ncbi:hypothetical protein HK405_015081 [Cladochytrium tenue]|nr:hypothetical protein HK405_015081 [Cladochytrium tenue]
MSGRNNSAAAAAAAAAPSTVTTPAGVAYSSKIPAPTKLPLQAPIRSITVDSQRTGNPNLLSPTQSSSSAVPTASSADASAGTAAKFRYSGDLELQLGFERNPLDKPSSDFRNADAWFKNVRIEDVDVSEPARPPPAAAAAGRQGSVRVPPGAQLGSLNRGGGSGGGPAGQKNNRGSFRNSFMFFRSSFAPRAARTAADFDDPDGAYDDDDARLRTNDRKRPLGPRGMGEAGRRGTAAPHMPGSGIDLPMPPLVRQPRMYTYAAVLIVSALAVVIAATSEALTSASPAFFVVASAASAALAAAMLVAYVWLGRRLFNYYDAPFLVCQDISLGGGSSSPGPSSPAHSAGDEEDGTGPGVAARFAQTLSRAAPLRRPTPNPGVPLADLALHAVALLLWIAALADVGAKSIPACSSNPRGAACSTPVLAAWALGALAALGIAAALLVKCLEFWRFGVAKSVLKKRIGR